MEEYGRINGNTKLIAINSYPNPLNDSKDAWIFEKLFSWKPMTGAIMR